MRIGQVIQHGSAAAAGERRAVAGRAAEGAGMRRIHRRTAEDVLRNVHETVVIGAIGGSHRHAAGGGSPSDPHDLRDRDQSIPAVAGVGLFVSGKGGADLKIQPLRQPLGFLLHGVS